MTGTGEMIERVAMALASDIEEGFPRFTHQRWDQLTELARQAMRQRARVVVEAMREPTTAMLRKADDTILTDEELERGPYEMLKAEWQTMIEAALE